MKIAVLLPELTVGGAERLIIEELNFFKNDDRFEFEVQVIFQPGQLYNEFKHTCASIKVWNAPHGSYKMLLTYFKLANYLRLNQFDILHCHLLDKIGPLVGRLANVPCMISTIHNDIKYGILERFSLGRNHIAIACGRKVADNIAGFIPSDRIRVLPNAIAISKCNKDYNFLNNYNTTGKTLLFSIGSLKKAKGFDLLIRGIEQVKKKYPDIILFIAGEGKERGHLQKIINKLNLADEVHLLGNVENIHSILPFADIYINSSRWEGLPMTILEAMSHSIPMIATNVGGNSEVVINHKTGLLIQPEDHSELAEAVCRLIEDKSLRRRFGKEAFSLFQTNYTIDKHCSTLAEIYLLET